MVCTYVRLLTSARGGKEAMRVRVGIVCTVFYYLAISKSFLLASDVREDNYVAFKEPLREDSEYSEYMAFHSLTPSWVF
jgi:hypothetical protein